ncbi:MalY/PatB family protein [Bacillus testis]|uniref:MalY/PatB family protein n=1 Tax=Bacillus testis TaxID=1622072 RepID=UPI00067F5D7A|nr:PatB family C-S lyase [Bacillus testis]
MSDWNFDEEINRRNTASLKWDFADERFGGSELLPMWVADTDFASPQEITDALVKRAQHPVYGYTGATKEVYDSVIHWLKDVYGWNVSKQAISFSPGVVSGFTMSILALSEPGDKILIHTPVYTPFFDTVKNNNRELVTSPLTYTNGKLKINFEDLEAKLKDGVKILLLCSPHNPGGIVWSASDLQQIGELCVKYDVIILSDEIHADLCLPGAKHYPIASLGKEIAKRTVTFMAPSKTFNVAGIQASIIICENEELLAAIDATQHRLAFHGLNLFAFEVIKAAYTSGKPWLDALVVYLQQHAETVQAFFAEKMPDIKVLAPQASYLVWIDCRALGLSDEELQTRLIKKGKIAVSPGKSYGPGGEGFIRLNIGCTTKTLNDGLQRIYAALKAD